MKKAAKSKKLTAKESEAILSILKDRFEKNTRRHKELRWDKVRSKLEEHADALWSLKEMERTGGEPDVIGFDKETGEFLFADCSPESPKGRVSLCYDGESLDSRKENRPKGSAEETAAAMGIELLSEAEYFKLQKLGEFDLKTSSWLKTPSELRKLGGALFGDRRFGRVFIYHNGAQSYYAARGFRGLLRV
jgi:hypothetical protein